MAGTIFICYRRDDSAGHAGRLFDRLSQEYEGRVFMDVAGIAPGQRWADVIQQTITACNVAIVLIGPRWLAEGTDGRPRLHAPDDPVRGEIAAALAQGVKIVPVLVGGAAVPQLSQLPADIAALLDWQTLRVDDDEFQHDTGKLLHALGDHLGETRAPSSLAGAPGTPGRAGEGEVHAATGIMAPVPVSARGVWLAAPVFVVVLLAIGGSYYLLRQPAPSRGNANDGRRPLAPGTLVASNTDSATPASAAGGAGMPPSVGVARPRPAGTAGARPADADEGPATAGGRAGRWAGLYTLESLTRAGAPQAMTGTMQISRVSDGRFRFDTHLTGRTGDVSLYQGTFEGGDSSWTTTINKSNDRRAVRTPVRQTVHFDGSVLTMESATEKAVWKKQ